jgi:hypothetical protein
MSYNLSVLTSVANCEDVIQSTQLEKSSLELRKSRLTQYLNNSVSNVDFIQGELNGIAAQIADLDTTIAALADGETKSTKIAERYRLLSRQITVGKRLNSGMGETHAERQHDLVVIEFNIAEKTIFLAALEARKVELQAA